MRRIRFILPDPNQIKRESPHSLYINNSVTSFPFFVWFFYIFLLSILIPESRSRRKRNTDPDKFHRIKCLVAVVSNFTGIRIRLFILMVSSFVKTKLSMWIRILVEPHACVSGSKCSKSLKNLKTSNLIYTGVRCCVHIPTAYFKDHRIPILKIT